MYQDNDTLFDRRTVERNIKQGLTTREAYEKWLAELEDSSELADDSTTHFVHTVDVGAEAPESAKNG